jgi:hypothetical protein
MFAQPLPRHKGLNMYVKHLKIKLINDVDSFLEHLKLLLGAEIGHTKLGGRLSGTWGRGHKGT